MPNRERTFEEGNDPSDPRWDSFCGYSYLQILRDETSGENRSRISRALSLYGLSRKIYDATHALPFKGKYELTHPLRSAPTTVALYSDIPNILSQFLLKRKGSAGFVHSITRGEFDALGYASNRLKPLNASFNRNAAKGMVIAQLSPNGYPAVDLLYSDPFDDWGDPPGIFDGSHLHQRFIINPDTCIWTCVDIPRLHSRDIETRKGVYPYTHSNFFLQTRISYQFRDSGIMVPQQMDVTSALALDEAELQYHEPAQRIDYYPKQITKSIFHALYVYEGNKWKLNTVPLYHQAVDNEFPSLLKPQGSRFYLYYKDLYATHFLTQQDFEGVLRFASTHFF